MTFSPSPLESIDLIVMSYVNKFGPWSKPLQICVPALLWVQAVIDFYANSKSPGELPDYIEINAAGGPIKVYPEIFGAVLSGKRAFGVWAEKVGGRKTYIELTIGNTIFPIVSTWANYSGE